MVTVLAVIAVSAYYSATVTAESAPWAYFSLHTRAWRRGLGALIALVADRLALLPARLRGLAATAGLVAIVASALVYSDSTAFPGVAAWLPVGGATLVIAAGCGPRVPVERLLAEPLMQVLGRISYSWYLWHWPLLVIVPMAVGGTSSTGSDGPRWSGSPSWRRCSASSWSRSRPAVYTCRTSAGSAPGWRSAASSSPPPPR